MVQSFWVILAAMIAFGCGDTASPNPSSQVPVVPPESPAGGSPPIGVVAGMGGASTLSGTSGGVGGQASLGSGIGGLPSGGEPGNVTPTKLEEHALVVTPVGGCALDVNGAIQCWGAAFKVGAVPSGKFSALVNYQEIVCGIRDDRVLQCFLEPTGSAYTLPTAAIEGVSAVGVHGTQIYRLDEGGKVAESIAPPFWVFPAPPPENERFAQVTAGYAFGCGLRRSDGSILCWDGNAPAIPDTDCTGTGNLYGELAAPSGTFLDMSTYDRTSCAVRNTGELACWGAGKGPNAPKTYPCDAAVTITHAVPPPGKFKRVAMGLAYGCAIAEDGHIECWGDGTADTCVVGSSECRQARPPAGTYEQVAVGLANSCAMTANRKITCWGYPGPNGGDGRTMPPVEFR